MNYRHSFHAGNFADCFKHALLVALLDALSLKASPFMVLDTHAGAGHYDLGSDAARRTGEAELGIHRLLASRPAGLQRFLALIDELGLYPGSPAITRAGLRSQDRLVCCEWHTETVRALRRLFRGDPQVHVHHRSGWEAVSALLPPTERRGLVFVDPPFESADEFSQMVNAIVATHDRFGHGIFAGWYPISKPAQVRGFHAGVAAQGVRDVIAIEFRRGETLAPGRFNGCGMIVINPPYTFTQTACDVATAVLEGLGSAEAGAGVTMIRLADE